MKHSLTLPELTLGVCYYPEHWEKALWKDDLQRMKQYGIQVIRVAEFSWSLMEPEEGRYDFSFWDEFLTLAQKEGMKVIFCTPTATPPAWLTEKYPEVLNANGDGNRIYHGMRRHYNLTSPKYWEFCDALITRMAEHFNQWDCIIGWQLDNEINCENNEYYAESDHAAFRDYLKKKYRTLEHLNEKMGTVFWSQTYTDWDQLHLARRSNGGTGIANPHLQLEQKRFVSHCVIEFFKRQIRILRPFAGTRFITTNGIFGDIDYQKLLEEGLDFITYDNYPNFANSVGRPKSKDEDLRDRNASFNLSRVRAISPVFGIMEQQSGPGGWNYRMMQSAPKPGQMRLWTMQAIAHGADFVSYFRWRTCSMGTEIYWHGLNDYSNLPNRRLDELSSVNADLQKLDGIAGMPYEASVGILTDYDNQWDGEMDQWHGPLTEASTDGWFRALQKHHIPFDFVDFREGKAAEELQKYSVLIYPHAAILTEARAQILKAYAEQGGTLLMGCRTGYKNEFGHCPMVAMPGYAAELCGVRVTDYTFLGPDDDPEYVLWGKELLPAPIFNDILEAGHGGTAEAVFSGNYYDGKTALVKKVYPNQGSAWYFGGCFEEKTAEGFIQKLEMTSPADEWFTLPETVEVSIRGTRMFLLNFESRPQKIVIKAEQMELLSGVKMAGEAEIPAYGVMVFTKN